MKLDRRTFVLTGAVTLAASAACAQGPVSKPTAAGAFAPLAGRLDAAVAAGKVPWAVLLICRDGVDIFTHAAGTDASHIDVLRSATKIATVTAFMTLVQGGQVSLDDPVSRFVSDFEGDKSGIKLRHLLAMNSGLPSTWREFSDDMPLDEAARVIARAPLRAAAGARFIYGNLGLTVAGRVAEVASGQVWPEFFQSSLAGPLGMDFSYAPLDTGRLGGGGRTNAASYGKLLKLQLAGGVLNGRRLLSADLIAEMQKPTGAAFVNPIRDTTAFGYGMGWWFDEIDGAGRPKIISDPGAWGAYPWIDLSRRYGAFLFVRKQLADGVALQRELRPLIERALDA